MTQTGEMGEAENPSGRLRRSGGRPAPGGPRAGGAPATPGSPARAGRSQSRAVSPSAPGLAAPTATGSLVGHRLPSRFPLAWVSAASRRTPRASSYPRRPAPGLPGALRFRQSARSPSLASGRLALGNARKLAGLGLRCLQKRSVSENRADFAPTSHNGPLCNVGVGGILARHNRVMSTPAAGRQGRLIPLASPAGRPGALAGCALRQGPARCTSHGPRLDREPAPRRGPPLAACTAPRGRAASGHVPPLHGCRASPAGHWSARGRGHHSRMTAALVRREGLQFFTPRRRTSCAIRVPMRPPREAPLRALLPLPAAFTYPFGPLRGPRQPV